MIHLAAHVEVNWSYSRCANLLRLIPQPRSRELCNQLCMRFPIMCTGPFDNSQLLLVISVEQWNDKCTKLPLTLYQQVTVSDQYSLGATEPAATEYRLVIHHRQHRLFYCIPKTSRYIKTAFGDVVENKSNLSFSWTFPIFTVSFRWLNSLELLTCNLSCQWTTDWGQKQYRQIISKGSQSTQASRQVLHWLLHIS